MQDFNGNNNSILNTINGYSRKRKWKLWGSLAGAVLGITALAVIGTGVYQKNAIQEGIADGIIRFHVVANSDSEEDQNLKIQVKENVVKYISELLKNTDSIDETRNILSKNMNNIQSHARQVIEDEGYVYPSSANLEECYFPVKSYGDITFPAGYYEALRIQIGESQGKNWWCVLYPNLCFIDSIHGVVPEEEKEELRNVLTKEEYDSLFVWKKKDYKISFKYLPFL